MSDIAKEIAEEVFTSLQEEFAKDPKEGITVYTEDWRTVVWYLQKVKGNCSLERMLRNKAQAVDVVAEKLQKSADESNRLRDFDAAITLVTAKWIALEEAQLLRQQANELEQ